MSKSFYTLSSLMSSLLDDTFFKNPIWSEFMEYDSPRFNPQECSSAYPVSNKYVDPQTKDLHIECSLTGVSEDEFSLDVVDGNKIVLDIHRNSDNSKKEISLQHGLKYVSDTKIDWSFNPQYHDISKAKVTYEYGLLSIVVPPRKEVATSKKLFGNFDRKALEAKESEKKAIESDSE